MQPKRSELGEVAPFHVTLEELVLRIMSVIRGGKISPMPRGFQVKPNCLWAVPQSYMEALTSTVQNALFLRWSWQEPVLQQLGWLSICIWMKTKSLLLFSLTFNIVISPPLRCPTS